MHLHSVLETMAGSLGVAAEIGAEGTDLLPKRHVYESNKADSQEVRRLRPIGCTVTARDKGSHKYFCR